MPCSSHCFRRRQQVAGEGYLSGRNRPDSARQTIHGCLEEEVGALTGGTRGKTLLASVRGELAKIRNGLGKPAGRAPSLALRHGLREFHSCPQCIIIYALSLVPNRLAAATG